MKNKILFILLILIVGASAYTISTFNDSSSDAVFNFSASGSNESYWINLPKNATLSSAVFNVTAPLQEGFGSSTQVTSNGNEQYSPVTEVDSNNVLHMAWLDNRTSGIFQLYYWNSSSATENLITSVTSDIGIYDLAVDSNGFVHIVYDSKMGGTYNGVYYINSSSSWAVLNISNSSTFNSQEPTLDTDSNNVVHIAWSYYESANTSYDIHYVNSTNYSDFDSGYVAYSSRNDVTPSLKVDSNDIVHIAWQDPPVVEEGTGEEDLFLASTCVGVGELSSYIYVANSSSSMWENLAVSGSSTIPYCSYKYPDLVLDENNYFHLAWHSTYGGRSWYLNNTGYWETLQTGTYIYYPDITVDSDGVKHIIFSNFSDESTPGLIKHISSKDNFVTTTTISTGAGYAPSVASANVCGIFATWGDDTSGDYDIYYARRGFCPDNPIVEVGDINSFTYTGEYYGSSNLTDVSTGFENYLTGCTPLNGNCTVPINVTVNSRGIMKLSDLNINYSTNAIVPGGLTFKLSNGSDVSINPVGENSTIYVYAGGELTASIPIDFSTQPNYTGWFSQAGINATDNRAFVNASPLSDANNSMNTSQKTLYLNFSNTTLGSVCVIDAAVSTSTLSDIVNNTQCTTAGGTVYNNLSTIEINGNTYFVIPNVENSGAVQIVNVGTNPPVLSDASVSPSSGDSDTSFTFTVTVTDADNDVMSYVKVRVGSVDYYLNEVSAADTNTNDGKDYSLSTPLPMGVFSYYFEASDGTYTATTSTYVGLSVGSGTPIIVSAPGFNFIWIVLLFFTATIIFYKLKI